MRLTSIMNERYVMKKVKASQSSSSTFKPYAIAVSTSQSDLDDFARAHQSVAKHEQTIKLCTLAHHFVHQVRMLQVRLDVGCHIFSPTKRSVLAFELAMYTELDCYIFESKADELLARRYFLAMSAMRRMQGKLQGSLHFAKPSKELVALCPQAHPELATVTSTIERCHADLQAQQGALWQALVARLRVDPVFETQHNLAKQVA